MKLYIFNQADDLVEHLLTTHGTYGKMEASLLKDLVQTVGHINSDPAATFPHTENNEQSAEAATALKSIWDDSSNE